MELELPPPVPVPDPLGGGGGGGFSDVGVDAPFVEERDEVKVMEELELKIKATLVTRKQASSKSCMTLPMKDDP